MSRQSLNRYLGEHGLAQLGDAGLIPQLAMGITNHDDFRKVLITVEPDKRLVAYEALRPHLRFSARPLDVYIAEANSIAEQQQLPAYDPATLTITPYKVPQVNLAQLAERAIEKGDPATSKHRLTMLCGQCKTTEVWYGNNKRAMVAAARATGWSLENIRDKDGAEVKEREVCPTCTLTRSRTGAIQ